MSVNVENRFGPTRLSPHANLINSKHKLDFEITKLVKEFCDHHNFEPRQVEIVVTYTGDSYAKVTIL